MMTVFQLAIDLETEYVVHHKWVTAVASQLCDIDIVVQLQPPFLCDFLNVQAKLTTLRLLSFARPC